MFLLFKEVFDMATLLKDGRVVKEFPSRPWYRELVNGEWVKSSSPITGEDIWEGRVLSEAELHSYIDKSGSPN